MVVAQGLGTDLEGGRDHYDGGRGETGKETDCGERHHFMCGVAQRQYHSHATLASFSPLAYISKA